VAAPWVKTDYSERLSRRKSRDTEPEMLLRRALFALGLRYRVDVLVSSRTRADVVFTKRRIVIFVDGCFWHNCPIHGRKVFRGDNADNWVAKMKRNTARDVRVTSELTEAGWTVLRFWECRIASSAPEIAREIFSLVEAA
jgi:DNA mismatch endonuclease (patch repair protein)